MKTVAATVTKGTHAAREGPPTTPLEIHRAKESRVFSATFEPPPFSIGPWLRAVVRNAHARAGVDPHVPGPVSPEALSTAMFGHPNVYRLLSRREKEGLRRDGHRMVICLSFRRKRANGALRSVWAKEDRAVAATACASWVLNMLAPVQVMLAFSPSERGGVCTDRLADALVMPRLAMKLAFDQTPDIAALSDTFGVPEVVVRRRLLRVFPELPATAAATREWRGTVADLRARRSSEG